MAYDPARHVVVMFGGSSTSTSSTVTVGAETWEWDGSQWTQLHPTTAPLARAFASMTYDSVRQRIVLYGGQGLEWPRGPRFDDPLDDTWTWDGTNWSPVSGVATPPFGTDHQGAWGGSMAFDSARGTTVEFGGFDQIGGCETHGGYKNCDENETWEWNGATWTHRLPTDRPESRDGAGTVYDPVRGATIVFGGIDNTSSPSSAVGGLLGDTWSWNGSAWTRISTATAPSARQYPSMAYNPSQSSAVLFGGLGQDSNGDVLDGDTWRWDGGGWTQLNPAVSPPARWWAAMAYDAARNQTVMFGGSGDRYNTDMDDLWTWDGTTWTAHPAPSPSPSPSPTPSPTPAASNFFWMSAPANLGFVDLAGVGLLPAARQSELLVYDRARKVTVLFGGLDSSYKALGDTWEWDGIRWTQMHPSTSPPARAQMAMAYDTVRHQVVLFGGFSSVALGDTWTWDGANWTRHSTPVAPAARGLASMSFDGARGVAVLFGGQEDSGKIHDDTWEWNGQSWTRRNPAFSPPARVGASMAYDGRDTVLFGGSAGGFAKPFGYVYGTWRWDGSTWSRAATTVDPPISFYAYTSMVFDPARHLSLMPTDDGGLWAWSGSDWSVLAADGGGPVTGMAEGAPAARCCAGWTYDNVRGRFVLFGGALGGYDQVNDTWEGAFLSSQLPVSARQPPVAGARPTWHEASPRFSR
jgi:hypothetical protein